MKLIYLFLMCITVFATPLYAVDKTYKASSGDLILDASDDVIVNTNLGIAISEPENNLHVNGSVQIGNMATPALMSATTGGGGTDFALKVGLNYGNENTSYGQIWMEPYVDSTARKIYFKRRPANDTGTAGITMTVDGANDKVLLGISSSTNLQPNDKLGIYTADGGGINFASSTNTDGWTIRANGTRLQIGENNVADRIYINAGGRIELSVRTDSTCGIGNVCSGAYTPSTTSNNAVVTTANLTERQHNWVRVGNMVTLSGRIRANASIAGMTDIFVPIPVGGNFTSAEQASGAGVTKRIGGNANSATGQSCYISSVSATTYINVFCPLEDISDNEISYTIIYEYK